MGKQLRRVFALLCCFALAVSCLAGCKPGKNSDSGGSASKDEKDKKTGEKKIFSVALTIIPDSVDPINCIGAGELAFIRGCYEGLVGEKNGTMDLEPVLAESYEAVDAKTYKFKLRKGVKFADGTEFNADAVVYNFERVKKLQGAIGNLVATVDKVQKDDDYNVTITLTEPNSNYLYSVAKIGFVSPTAAKENEKDGDYGQAYFAQKSVGTGPYQVSEWVTDQYVTLSRYNDYWQGWKEGQLDEIKLIAIPDNATQVQMLNSGEVDKLQIPITEYKDMWEGNPDMEILEGDALQANIFTFNTQKAPFDNVKVRQAVTYAFDYQSAKDKVYNGYASIPHGFLPTGFKEFNKDIPEQKQDVEKAKQLMKEAGVKDTEISIHLCEGSDDQTQMAQILQSNLKEIGIKLNIKIVPWLTLYNENADPKNAPEMSALNMGAFTGDAAFFMNQNFNSRNIGQPYNWSFYKNEEFDANVAKAEATLDENEKAEYLGKAQQILVDDAPALFAASPGRYEVINKRIKGYVLHPLDYFHAMNYYKLTYKE